METNGHVLFLQVNHKLAKKNRPIFPQNEPNKLDCEKSLFFFGIVEGSPRFVIVRIARLRPAKPRAARIKGRSPRKVKITTAMLPYTNPEHS